MFDAAGDSATSRRSLTASLQLIACSNCAVNPVIYCLLNERFKARVKRLAVAAKWWGSSGSVADGHLQAAGGSRTPVKAAASPARLGLLLSRSGAVSVDIARAAGRDKP